MASKFKKTLKKFREQDRYEIDYYSYCFEGRLLFKGFNSFILNQKMDLFSWEFLTEEHFLEEDEEDEDGFLTKENGISRKKYTNFNRYDI